MFSIDEARAYFHIERTLPRITPMVVREYAAPRPSADDLSIDSRDTILWQPVIVLPTDGKAKLQFHLGNRTRRISGRGRGPHARWSDRSGSGDHSGYSTSTDDANRAARATRRRSRRPHRDRRTASPIHPGPPSESVRPAGRCVLLGNHHHPTRGFVMADRRCGYRSVGGVHHRLLDDAGDRARSGSRSRLIRLPATRRSSAARTGRPRGRAPPTPKRALHRNWEIGITPGRASNSGTPAGPTDRESRRGGATRDSWAGHSSAIRGAGRSTRAAPDRTGRTGSRSTARRCRPTARSRGSLATSDSSTSGATCRASGSATAGSASTPRRRARGRSRSARGR